MSTARTSKHRVEPHQRPLCDLRIGTSGWHYASWWGPSYPKDVKKIDALRYYSTQFNATELNAPFYRTPSLETVQGWFDQTPDDFRFAWKGSKFITHWKQLSERSENSLELLETRLSVLRYKAGPVLFQLPPRMIANRDRLASFSKMLNPARRYSFEFRHPSWYVPSILSLLRDNNFSLCLSDHAAAPAPHEPTADWVYIRNHGPTGRYHGNYSDATVREWSRDIADWRRKLSDIWVFFDNDVKSAAPKDASRLVSESR
jgi:uncharacterized protein YecE (DUF72 family)